MIPTITQMAEIKKLAVDVVLASELSGRTDAFVAQALFIELPSDHFLLRDHWARHEFSSMLKKQRATIEREKQALRS